MIQPFLEELEKSMIEYDLIRLHDRRIGPCTACRRCQQDWTAFGCAFDDDMTEIADKILASDMILLATPIYSWYCTPPMKAMLDRLVYGMNKYYGEEKGPALWKGKRAAIVATCGYRPENGADLFEEGIRRYCRHSQLNYIGMLAERDPGYNAVFMTGEKAGRARAFAQKIVEELKSAE